MRRTISVPLAAASLLLALLATACAAYRSQHAPPSAPPPARTAATTTTAGEPYTLARLQEEVFTPGCATARCHSTQDESSGLALTPSHSYAALVGQPSQEKPDIPRVKPGDPDGSYLIQKLRGDSGIRGVRMPKNGPPYLTPEQIEGIAAWIRAGAPAS